MTEEYYDDDEFEYLEDDGEFEFEESQFESEAPNWFSILGFPIQMEDVIDLDYPIF